MRIILSRKPALPSWLIFIILSILTAVVITSSTDIPVTFTDTSQLRLTDATATFGFTHEFRQTFVAQHDGLSELEFLVVVHSPDPSQITNQPPTLTVSLLEEPSNQKILSQSIPLEGVQHNDPIRISFPPIRNSYHKLYAISIEASYAPNISLWVTSYDAYPSGKFSADGAPFTGDLRFETQYTLVREELIRGIISGLPNWFSIGIPALLILFLPGIWLLTKLKIFALYDRWVILGMSPALSLSFIPFIWVWTSAAKLPLSSGLIRNLAVLIVVVALASFFRKKQGGQSRNWDGLDWLYLAVILLIISSRMIAIRDLVFPPLVDVPNHAYITRLLFENGTIPETLGPELAFTPLYYHPGFHAIAATIALLTQTEIPTMLLILGQLLAIIAPITVGAMVSVITKERLAGLVATFFVAFISMLPNEYSNWGRYTHLMGTIILSSIIALTFYSHNNKIDSIKRSALLVFLTGGLLVTHYRVFVFFLVFILCYIVLNLTQLKQWLFIGILSLISIFPWIQRLYNQVLTPIDTLLSRFTSTIPTYNLFPIHYARSDLEPLWLILGLLFMIWAIRRHERWAAVHTLWIGLLFILLNLNRFGLPDTWLVTNNTWYITLFIPGGLLIGWGCMKLWDHFKTERKILTLAIFGLLIGSIFPFRFARVINTIDPRSVLATQADLQALQWIRESAVHKEKYLINAWHWTGDSWAGADGGYWILPYTNHQTNVPPFSYGLSPELWHQVNDFATFAWEQTDVNNPDFLARMKQEGITGVYIGAKGQHFLPQFFLDSPNYNLQYTNGEAWVFSLINR